MLVPDLFGNETAEKTLLYLAAYDEGYANGIARLFEVSVNQVQRQLLKLERAGILASQLKGKTRIFLWNPRFFGRDELVAFLLKTIRALPPDLQQRYFRLRTRPRRTGKALV